MQCISVLIRSVTLYSNMYKVMDAEAMVKYAKTWETWLLDKAGVKFTPQTQPLRLVKANP